MNKERRFYIRIIKKKRDSIRIKKKEETEREKIRINNKFHNYYKNKTRKRQFV